MQTQPISNSPAAAPTAARAVSRFLGVLFIVACLLADAVVTVHLAASAGIVIAVYLGLTFGQLTLAAIWCVRGRLPWMVRWAATLLLAAWLARGGALATYATWNEWLAVLGVYTLAAAIAYEIVDLFTRRHCVSAVHAQTDDRWQDATGRGRWSLRGMLSVMTVVGLALGPGRWITLPWADAAMVAGHLGALLAVAATTMWALRSSTRFATRCTAISGVALGAGVLLARLDPTLGAWHFSLALLCEAAVIGLGNDLLFADQKSWRSM